MTTVRVPGQPLASLDGLSRADWLALRRGGIGASDAPAVVGVSPFTSTYALWAEKTSDHWPEEDSAAMEWGRRSEDMIAQKFAEETGMRLHRPSVMYVHPERDWMRASPDRLHMDSRGHQVLGNVQIKTGSNYAHEWDGDTPPEHVIVQVQHEMEVVGCNTTHVIVLLNGRDFRSFVVPRDDRLVDAIVHLEEDFWRRVVEHDPPPVDGHESTSGALRILYGDVTAGAERLLDSETAALVDELRHSKALLAGLKQSTVELENRIKAALGDADTGIDAAGVPLVTWKQQNRRRVDLDALRSAHPDLVAEFEVETATRTFLLKKPKGDQ